MNDRVYIIVLNWNGTKDTIECLRSIKTSSYLNYMLIVVDNGSENESLNQLKSWCKNNFGEVLFYNKEQAEIAGTKNDEEAMNHLKSNETLIFIENNENLGFAAGNNVALRYLLKNNATYVMLLNNDTTIDKDSVNIMMDFIRLHSDYVAVTPQIRYYKPRDRVWNCGGKIMWFGNRRYYYADKNVDIVPVSGFKRITFITGCAMLFKPSVTGILSEKFFFGEEDFDFSFRQKIANRKMACCFSSIIYHKISVSSRKINNNILGSIYIHYLSRLIDNRQYSSSFMFFIKIILNLGYAILLMLIRYKVKPKKIYLLIKTMLIELNRLDEISKEYFLKAFKEEFNHPVIWDK